MFKMSKKSTLLCMELKDARFTQPRPGMRRKVLVDEQTPTNSLISGFIVLDPGAKIPLHYHDIEELQFIVYGYGTIRDIDGTERPARAGTFLYCPSGPNGAHEFDNTGDLPLSLIFVYPSPGGKAPPLKYVEKQG